jgi:hypothetical protein
LPDKISKSFRTKFLKIRKRNYQYQVQLINKSFDFLNGVVRKTYKITKVIYKSGVVKKIKVIFVTIVLVGELIFGTLKIVKPEATSPIIQSTAPIEKLGPNYLKNGGWLAHEEPMISQKSAILAKFEELEFLEGPGDVVFTKGVDGYTIIPPLSRRSSSPQSSSYPQFPRKHQPRGRNSVRNYQPGPRIAPQMVDNGLGGQGAGNGAGAGGGGGDEFSLSDVVQPSDQKPNEHPVQPAKPWEHKYNKYYNQDSQESQETESEANNHQPTTRKKIVSRIKENPALVREAKRMGKDRAAQKDVHHLIEQLAKGNKNPGIGNQRVKGLKNVSEARGRNEGRVYFREKDGKIEILAKSNKDNQNKVIGILQKMGY